MINIGLKTLKKQINFVKKFTKPVFFNREKNF